jgi:hypothetical protein
MTSDKIYDNIIVGRTDANPVYARRGTFNKAKQHFYPSRENDLSYELEAPYAHSLSNGARYWTREDALSDIRWNSLAITPCLNCLLDRGRSSSRACDLSMRREASLGMVGCCTRCEDTGQEQACVELIEVRATHIFEPLPDTSGSTETMVQLYRPLKRFSESFHKIKDIGIWGRNAHEQRASGLVAWRPVNLLFGDDRRKAQVVAEYEQMKQKPVMLEPNLDQESSPCPWRLKYARGLVKAWDQVDKELELRGVRGEALPAQTRDV